MQKRENWGFSVPGRKKQTCINKVQIPGKSEQQSKDDFVDKLHVMSITFPNEDHEDEVNK